MMHGRPIHVSRVIHSFNFCAHCADEEIDNKVVGELHRKIVANATWNHHVEQELKHDKCSDDCKKRGNLLYIALCHVFVSQSVTN